VTAAAGPARPRRAFAVAAIGLAIVAAVVAATLASGPAPLDRARQGEAVRAADGVQELAVTVAQGVYSPNVLRAKAGVPLRLRVEVRERHSCATKLLVPDLKLDVDLPPQGRVDLLIPPAPAGSYLFTCGLKMVKGSIVFE
jgi:plastocyanin domain-containing protein